MLRFGKYIIPTLAGLVVMAPLLYLQFVGQVSSGHTDSTGNSFVEYRYGWPSIYGTRQVNIIHGVEEVWPLKFSRKSFLFGWTICVAMVAGTFYVARSTASALRKRQCSLRNLLLLPMVVAGTYSFIKYDRSPDLVHFLVASAPHDPYVPTIPVQFSRAITDCRPYLFAPVLFGLAAGISATASIAVTIIAFLIRSAYRNPGEASSRRARNRMLAIVALLCLAGASVYLAMVAYRCRAICHAAAYGKLATKWVGLYVFMHDGEWPRSWDAIRECLRDPRVPTVHNDEAMIESVQAYIAIDFQANPSLVASQKVAEFDAIRPLDRYGVDHREYWDVEFLIDTFQYVKEYGPNAAGPQRGSPLSDSTSGRMAYGSTKASP